MEATECMVQQLEIDRARYRLERKKYAHELAVKIISMDKGGALYCAAQELLLNYIEEEIKCQTPAPSAERQANCSK